jgi:hypothetical protein
MERIDDLSDAEFMKLQAEYSDSLPICPICTLEDVRHLLLELVMAERGDGSAHLGGDEEYDDDGAPQRTQ